MKRILLINISTQDRAGVTASLSELLSAYAAQIVDIGQALIHNSLSLGVMVLLEESVDGEALREQIQSLAQQMDIDIALQDITGDDYQRWVELQEQPRHIVTLLARNITALQIASIGRIVAKQGLNIDKINRLSGRVALDEDPNTAKACLEFSLRGETPNLPQLRESLLSAARDLNVDIAYQEDNIYRRYRRLVVFDMDSTLIEAEVIDELAKEAGVGEQVSAITEAAMRGEIDFSESFRRRVALLAGLSEAALQRVSSRIMITEGAALLITTLKSLGYKTAILSGGFTYFAEKLQHRLGIDYVYANNLEIKQGAVTGRVVGEIVDGDRKAALLTEIAHKEGINLEQVIAVGDGANDLPMLSLAGLGIAFRAKPLVRATAKHAISNLGLDGILYLIGFRDRDWGEGQAFDDFTTLG